MKVFRAGVPNPGNGSSVASNSQPVPAPPTVPALGNADGSSLPVAQATLVGTL